MDGCKGAGSSKGGGGGGLPTMTASDVDIEEDIKNGLADNALKGSHKIGNDWVQYDYNTLLTNAENKKYANTDYAEDGGYYGAHPGDQAYGKIAENFNDKVASNLGVSADSSVYNEMRGSFGYNREITKALREGKTLKQNSPEGKGLRQLDKLFNASKVDKDYTTFRGANFTDKELKSLGFDKPQSLKGLVIKDKGYACQTTSLHIASNYAQEHSGGKKQVIFINTIKQGQKAIFADETYKSSGYGSALQLTTNRGSSFIVKQAYIKNGVTFVHTETIQED